MRCASAIGGRRYDGVASFGRRPMFDIGAVLLEVFLFDFSGDLYGQTIDVAFIDWIREERMFASVDDAVAQMQEDSRRAREALARARRRVSADLRSTRPARPDCARCSRAHCAAMKPSSANGTSALPAERAADLHGGGEDFRIEQPRRRMRAGGAREDRALAGAPPRQQRRR